MNFDKLFSPSEKFPFQNYLFHRVLWGLNEITDEVSRHTIGVQYILAITNKKWNLIHVTMNPPYVISVSWKQMPEKRNSSFFWSPILTIQHILLRRNSSFFWQSWESNILSVNIINVRSKYVYIISFVYLIMFRLHCRQSSSHFT